LVDVLTTMVCPRDRGGEHRRARRHICLVDDDERLLREHGDRIGAAMPRRHPAAVTNSN
jgi:hypothetical protein